MASDEANAASRPFHDGVHAGGTTPPLHPMAPARRACAVRAGSGTRRVHELPRVPARLAVATGEPGTVPVVDAHVGRSNRGMHGVSVHGGGAKATMTSADAVS